MPLSGCRERAIPSIVRVVFPLLSWGFPEKAAHLFPGMRQGPRPGQGNPIGETGFLSSDIGNQLQFDLLKRSESLSLQRGGELERTGVVAILKCSTSIYTFRGIPFP